MKNIEKVSCGRKGIEVQSINRTQTNHQHEVSVIFANLGKGKYCTTILNKFALKIYLDGNLKNLIGLEKNF